MAENLELDFVHDESPEDAVFDETWNILASEYEVDSFGGAQYRRIYMKWKEEGKPTDDSMFDRIYELIVGEEEQFDELPDWTEEEGKEVRQAMEKEFSPQDFEVWRNDGEDEQNFLHVSTKWNEEGFGLEKKGPDSFCLWETGVQNTDKEGKPLKEVIKELIEICKEERRDWSSVDV